MNSEFTIAVHSLVLLAYKQDHMATSEAIACNVSTHPARVRKVMSILRKRGYVKTKEGHGGGYLLQCDPDRVTLAEIYRAMCPGSLKPSWISGNPDEPCAVACHIPYVMDRVFTDAERHLEAYLEQVTIGSVLRDIDEAVRHKQDA